MPVGLAHDGDVHRLLDAVLDAGKQRLARRAALEGAAPFAQGRHEHRRHRMIGGLGELLIELVERLARPEYLFELRRAARERAERQPFVDDDRPRPQRGQKQDRHHRLHDRIGAHEQRDDRDAAHIRAETAARLGDIDIGGGGGEGAPNSCDCAGGARWDRPGARCARAGAAPRHIASARPAMTRRKIMNGPFRASNEPAATAPRKPNAGKRSFKRGRIWASSVKRLFPIGKEQFVAHLLRNAARLARERDDAGFDRRHAPAACRQQ